LIQLYRRSKRRNIRGQFSFPSGSRKYLSCLNRYIDQCQELLDAPATLGERKALEVYALAVQAARGDTHDYWPEEIPKEFFSYIERSSTQYLDGGKKEALPVSFDYDRWLSGG
jgi:phosphatidylinositol 3,5-bisphosphate 5-phosphatase